MSLVVVGSASSVAGAVTTVTAGTTVTDTYSYTGATETLTVPANVTQITMTITGAEGGQGGRDSSGTAPAGGYQGVVTGTITVTPGEVLTIGVGQGGADSPDWNVCTPGSGAATGDPNDGVGGTNPLGGYAGGAGGSPGASGCSGYGGSGGAASVVEVGTTGALSSVATIVAGGSGGSGGSGQFAPTQGQISLPNYIARPDQTSTTGQYGESVYTACHQVSGEGCDGGGGAGGGGGAQGGSAGLVEFGSGTSDEWFGLGGYPGESSTGGESGLSAQYNYYSNDNANGTVVLSYTTGAPSAPSGINGTPGNTNVALYWTAPTSPGTTSISGYSVQYATSPYSTWTSAPECTGTTTSCVVTGLTNGTAYEFEVAASNSIGTGVYSAPSGPITPSGPPGAPNIITVTPSDGSLTLAFSAASSALAITDYQYSLNGGTSWVSGGVTTSPLTISGLTNGTPYSIELRGVSSAGGGASSSPATGTPSALPGAPTITAITAGGDGVSLQVAFVPGYTGGSPILTYQYATSVGSGTTAFGSWTTASGTTSPITITGLASGTTYSVELRATNTNGVGPGSVYQVGVTLTVAAAPTITSVTPSDSALTVTYAPFTSSNDGGSAISGVDYSLDGGTTWISAGTLADPFTISSLTNGTVYNVEIRANNGVGSSQASTAVAGTPRTLPGAPVNVQATGSATSTQVNWSAPLSSGGAAITSYTASAFAAVTGGSAVATCTSSTTTCLITGLTNDTTYYVSVTATNAAGTGPASSPRASTLPVALPGAPTITALTAGDSFLAIPFTAGTADTNNPVTGYQYSTDSGVTWHAATGTTMPVTVSGLTNGTSYTVELRATSANGSGAASNSEPGTPYAAPDPTANATTSYTAGSGQVTVTWVAPNNNGAAISSYTVTAFTAPVGGTQVTTCTTATLSCTLSGLSNGTSYYISIQSVNVHTEYSLRSSPLIPVVPGTASTTSLGASPTSSTYNGPVILTATVTSGATGTVNFEVGGVSIAGCSSVTVTAASATCTTTALLPGTDSLQAFYSGNSTYASSQSAVLDYVVAAANQAALSVTTTSSTFAVSPGNTASLSTSGGTTAGSVGYVISGTNSAGCSVSGATLTYTSAGTCTVTATMLGNTNYNPVSSAATVFTVNAASPTTGLGESPTSSTYANSVTLTATVTSGATGTVNFEVGGVTIAGCGTEAITAGVAHCTTTALPEGSDSLEALYSGDGNFSASHSSTTSYSVGVATQAPLSVTSVAGTIGIDLILSTAGGSGTGSITYVVANGTTTCSQPSPGELHASGAGTCLVTATKASDANYAVVNSNATTVTFTENQTLLFTSTAPTSAVVHGTYTPSASSSASLTVAISVDASSSSICTISAGAVTFSASGICLIDANQGGQGNILAATQVQQSITVSPALQHSAPSAPLDVTVTATTDGVLVSWTAPASPGSSPITVYDVSVAPGGLTCTSVTTSCSITGLESGGSFTIAVTAVNASGNSPAGTGSFTPAVSTPTTVLAAPIVTVNDGTVTVTWQAPTGSDGPLVTGYVVTLEPGGQQCTTTTATTCSISGVPSASVYSARVTVLDASGSTLASATGKTKTTTKPPARVVAVAHFTFDSYALTAKDRTSLTRFATMVVATKVHLVSLFGFTDDVGNLAYNKALSQERANAVGQFLTAQLTSKGYHGLSIREMGEGILRAGASRAQDRKVAVVL